MLRNFIAERLTLSSGVLLALTTAGIILVHTIAPWRNKGSCEQLAFASNRNGNWEIYLLDVQSQLTVNLTNSRTDEDYPFWSADGNQLAYTVTYMAGIRDIVVQAMDTGDLRHYALPSTPYGNSPQLSSYNPGIINTPRTQPLLYVSAQGTTTHLMLLGMDGERQIASHNGQLFAPNLSADSRCVAYIAGPIDDRRIYMVDLESGSEQLLIDGSGDYSAAVWRSVSE
jgi:Tol biopolymer transport system component